MAVGRETSLVTGRHKPCPIAQSTGLHLPPSLFPFPSPRLLIVFLSDSLCLSFSLSVLLSSLSVCVFSVYRCLCFYVCRFLFLSFTLCLILFVSVFYLRLCLFLFFLFICVCVCGGPCSTLTVQHRLPVVWCASLGRLVLKTIFTEVISTKTTITSTTTLGW